MKYCEGIDCAWCKEKEPCIYKEANKLSEALEKIEKLTKTRNKGCKNCEELIKESHCNDKCNAYKLNKILQTIKECKE